MPRFEWLRPDLRDILQEHPDWYWLSYQILERLRERNPETVQRLEQEHGTAVGRGGGWQYGPATAISQCLEDMRRDGMVDMRYLYAKGLRIGDTEASYDYMGIFRWLDGEGDAPTDT